MNGWSTRAIQTLVNAAPKTKQPLSDTNVWNLNLDQIESHGGRVLEKVYVSTEKLGPSTFAFESRTVLYSKLRPYLNKVVVADEAGFATTELVPLRCNPDELHPEYLAYFLRSEEFLKFATEVVAGAKMPRMVMSEFWNFQVPLPPLPEQRRIAAILDQADALRAKRREALAQLDSLTQSIFIEMFGDPSTNSKNWDVVRLSDEVSIQGGFAFKSSDYVSSGIPLIRIGDVNRSSGANENQCFLPKYWAEKYSRFLIHPGSLLMSLTGTTGKDDYGNVVVLSNHSCEYFLNQRVACIKPIGDRISKAFLHSFLKDKKVKSLIVSKSRGVRQANISNGDILELSLPVPPLKLQVKYSECIDQLESLKFQHKNSISELNTLFASLQHRAFRGEL